MRLAIEVLVIVLVGALVGTAGGLALRAVFPPVAIGGPA